MSSFRMMPSGSGQPWFRLGRLEVGTVMAVVLATVASWLAWVIVPSLPTALFFTPDAVAAGQIWRLVTWPFAEGLSLWTVLNLFFFWYFGTELEQMIGRGRMAWLLAGIMASLTVAAAIVGLTVGGSPALAGLGEIEFVVLLLWIAEYPRRPFFFGIPAWVIGAVLLGLQVLQLMAARGWANLLALLLGLVLAVLVARRVGLLTEYAWIPGGQRRPRPVKQSKGPRRSRGDVRTQQRQTSDRERLDQLLDRINADGIAALSDKERKELVRLRDRLRGQR